MSLFLVYFMVMGLFCFIFIRKHILLCLMSLEFIVLYLLFMIFIFCMMYDYSFYFYILLMTFFVCEGALGLSVLVSMIRSHGNDYLNSLMLW
uniref:NADH-ubiquinone oxidoreductase chain 4L n=1 Tax=Japanagallia multispina TaxID=3071386 RepID=A0AA50QGD6_9HEMI|nr:NADH dehydrogenase subunit 4L [Japanagallia multispina]WMC21072.1 NADH dehydrogenase subunit 4L [Japanagallia multispina]